MRLLLDAHSVIWWWTGDKQLSEAARTAILDPDNEVFVSAACAWEIATKHRIGKLGTAGTTADRFEELMALDGFRNLAVTVAHGLRAGCYVQVHKDPFDRMLAAQAELENMLLITIDPELHAFPIEILW